MKVFKLLVLILGVSLMICACDDDNNTPDIGIPETVKIETSFEQTAKSVLKNAGIVEIPVVLAEAPVAAVKISVAVKEESGDNIAREGLDFDIISKVISIESGKTMGNIQIQLANDEKTGAVDKEFELIITGVFGGGKKAETKQNCRVSIMNNSFIEFEKTGWETWEAAAVEGVDEQISKTRFVPLQITGEVKAQTKVIVAIVDSTAKEYVHFTLASKEVTVNPGDQQVFAEIIPIDDILPNDDRIFTLVIKEVSGSNLVIAKSNTECRVKIISEEIMKTVSFTKTSFSENDKEQVIEIPIAVDKDPGHEITVGITVDSESTAQADVDYQIINPNVKFSTIEGGILQVKLIGDNLVNGDRKLILKLDNVDDISVSISETNSNCIIDIINNDFPSFSEATINIKEQVGNYNLKVAIPPVNVARTMKVSFVNNEAIPGTFFTVPSEEITVPADATEVDIPITLGVNLTEPVSMPSLKITVDEVDGFVLEVGTITTTLQLERNPYRDFMGNWAYTCENRSSATDITRMENFEVIISGGETEAEQIENFGKRLVAQGFRGYTSLWWSLSYDTENDALSANLLENMRGIINFGASAPYTPYTIKLALGVTEPYGNWYSTTTKVDVTFNKNRTVITFPENRTIISMLYDPDTDERKSRWSGIFYNNVMTKK